MIPAAREIPIEAGKTKKALISEVGLPVILTTIYSISAIGHQPSGNVASINNKKLQITSADLAHTMRC